MIYDISARACNVCGHVWLAAWLLDKGATVEAGWTGKIAWLWKRVKIWYKIDCCCGELLRVCAQTLSHSLQQQLRVGSVLSVCWLKWSGDWLRTWLAWPAGEADSGSLSRLCIIGSELWHSCTECVATCDFSVLWTGSLLNDSGGRGWGLLLLLGSIFCSFYNQK